MGNIIKEIRLDLIKRNPEQPRKYFDNERLEELKESIIQHGVINPITVKKTDNCYQIIAGERRFRASIMAGKFNIPCVVMSPDNEKGSIIAIVENIQRCDLDFIEEAVAYKKLIDEFSLKQDDIAKKVSKTQSAIANKLRILKLEPQILHVIREYNLTERHARALLKLPAERHTEVLEYVIQNNLNVARTESYIERLLVDKKSGQKMIKMVKDVRLFINTINKSVKIMQEAGVLAKVDKVQSDEFLTYTIIIPMQAK